MEYKKVYGIGPQGVLISTIIFIIFLELENFFNIKRLIETYDIIWAISLLLIILAIIIFLISFNYLPTSKRSRTLVTSGPHKLVRHPIYATIIFFFYPAFALLFGSWILLSSTALIYIIFNMLVKKEESFLLHLFGKKYKEYMHKTPRFLPGIR